MSNNQKALLVIESLVLSGPMLLYICTFLFLGIFLSLYGHGSAQSNGIILLSLCAFFVLIIVLPNLLFFSVLKNKLNMGIETFLYGIGFLSGIASLDVFFSGPGNSSTSALGEEIYSLLLIILLFASLYYTYATALKKNEKGSGKLAFFLLIISIVFFIIVTINNFEIIKQYFETFELNYDFFQSLGVSPILFGLYAGHYAVYRTLRVSLRNLAWSSFLVVFFIVFSILFHILGNAIFVALNLSLPVFCILISFIFSCFAGAVCKLFKKNQSTKQTNE